MSAGAIELRAPLRLVAGVGLSDAAAAALDVTPTEVIERWLAALSPHTRRGYARALQRFATWALAPGARPEQALQVLCEAGCGPAHEMVARWRDAMLTTDNLAPGSVACYVAAIGSLLRACHRAGLATWRLAGVSPRPERRQDRSGPRRGEVELLLASIDRRAAAGKARAVRDAAIVRLLYCAALRRAEVVGLRLDDLQLDHPDGPQVSPRRKGNRERSPVLIGDTTAAALRRWLAVRGDLPGRWVFHAVPGDGTRPLAGECVRSLLATAARRAGCTSPIRPHGLRHSAATECAKRGSLAELMALGGWRSFTAAQSYLDRRQDERRRALAIVEA